MAKHQQPKIDTKRHTRDPFSTNEVFNKLNIESQRMERINQQKFAQEKASRIAKEQSKKVASTTANKLAQGHKQRKVKQPEHSLATAFSDTIDDSREHIRSKAYADIDAASLGLAQNLTISDQRFRSLEQDANNENGELVKPFKTEELEWVSADGNRTGKTILGQRMKKFQKTIETQEQELARQFDDWNNCNDELRDVVLEYFGPEGLKQLENGVFEMGNVLSKEHQQFRDEIEAEKQRFAAMIKTSTHLSVKQMTDSERKLQLKQKKIEQDFMAMLADEEY